MVLGYGVRFLYKAMRETQGKVYDLGQCDGKAGKCFFAFLGCFGVFFACFLTFFTLFPCRTALPILYVFYVYTQYLLTFTLTKIVSLSLPCVHVLPKRNIL